MASFGIHLLVAEEYLKLHKIDGVEEFIKGNFAPDMVDDKVASHYSTYNKTMSYTDTLKNKVDLVQYVNHNDIDSDLKKGEFYHLFTDYVFYTQYLIHLNTYKKLAKANTGNLNEELYTEYNRLMHWLKQNYTLNYLNMIPSEYGIEREESMQLFDGNSIRRVVNYLADIDIDMVYNLIKNTKGKFSLKLKF